MSFFPESPLGESDAGVDAGAAAELELDESSCWRRTLPFPLDEGLGVGLGAGEGLSAAGATGAGSGEAAGELAGAGAAAGAAPSQGGGLKVPGAQLKDPSLIPLHTSAWEMVLPLKENS